MHTVEGTASGNVAVYFFEELDNERYFLFSTGKVNAEEIQGGVVETRALSCDVPWTGHGILVEVDLKMGGSEIACDFVVGPDVDCVGVEGDHGHGEVCWDGQMVCGQKAPGMTGCCDRKAVRVVPECLGRA